MNYFELHKLRQAVSLGALRGGAQVCSEAEDPPTVQVQLELEET